jgi:alkylation response protein AidB-like acyl-CoA dehydrogenase
LTVAATIVHITRRPAHDTNEERTAAVDFAYTPEQLELRARARSLADEIEVHELACEEHNGLPPAIHREVTDAVLRHGLNAINMPAEWGGQGLSVVEQVIVQEQLGRLTNALWDMVWRPANALRACDDAQRERYLVPGIRGERRDCVAVTERDAGSDPTAIASTATRRDDGGYTLNGEKWFVTVGDAADYMIVLANVMPERAPTLFLVDKDTPGVRVLRTPRYMHTFVYEHPEFTYTDVFVPDADVLGEVGQGYDITRSWFTEERLMIAARTIGAAERALGLARDWAVQRKQFGRAIAEFQLVQGMLADSAVDIAVNRAFTHQVAVETDHGTDRKTLHAKAAMAKLSSSEASGRVVDRCLQIFGGRGYDRTYPVERLYREVRVDRIWEGTSEIQRIIVAGELRKRGLGVLRLPSSDPGFSARGR